jgi:hypothetical protein
VTVTPAVDRLQAELRAVAAERDTLICGWIALGEIAGHDLADCVPCRWHAVALICGAGPSELAGSRCEQARRWLRAVDAAATIVEQHAARTGRDDRDGAGPRPEEAKR